MRELRLSPEVVGVGSGGKDRAGLGLDIEYWGVDPGKGVG